MSSDAAEIAKAAAILRAGGIVAMPTETVYGLAADATNDLAVARVYEAKGRPAFNPLIVHVTDARMAKRYTEFSPFAERLAAAFWPGPLTLVLPLRADAAISSLVTAGLDTIAVRAPAHPVARALIAAADRPLAAPSANPSGTVSPTRASHVRDGLGAKVDLILDGGPCAVGVESTIVKIDDDRATLLRPGGVPREAIKQALGASLASPTTGAVEAPGMLASHYAPRARLRLNAERPRADEAYLAFGAAPADHPDMLNLSPAGDLVEAAANLFAHLRALDALCAAKGLSGIAAATVPMKGLGEAINDRLSRAAAPRKSGATI
ncbi:MAG: L-threonylcarbamoyladenylate synthase [Parvularculaceae bacterium]